MLKELKQKEHSLQERKTRLSNSIQKLKSKLNEGNIEEVAEELTSLETQLQLTEIALQNTQEQFREQEKFLSSKEYADKQKQLEKLRKQAQNKAGEAFRTLQVLQKQCSEAQSIVKQHDRLNRELTQDKTGYSGIAIKQPFAWLRMVQLEVSARLKDTVFFIDKLEV